VQVAQVTGYRRSPDVYRKTGQALGVARLHADHLAAAINGDGQAPLAGADGFLQGLQGGQVDGQSLEVNRQVGWPAG
jgi:hypothetical protein